MKKRYLLVLVSLIILTAGCNTQGLMKSKDLQNATQNMAKNESLQKAFSDGRIHVMHNLVETKRSILQNTLHEQHMMIDDPKLSQQLLALNINLNQMMMSSSSGKEQLTQSTLQIMDGINKDLSRLRSFIRFKMTPEKRR
jgi:predicted small secreted protein